LKLDKQQLQIIRSVREALEKPNNWYICIVTMDEIQRAKKAELELLRNKIMFWRRYSIGDRWNERQEEILHAIRMGLSGFSTVGGWLEFQVRRRGLSISGSALHNNRMYKNIRFAWLDRILDTGEIDTGDLR
jgi:hypothetical protein